MRARPGHIGWLRAGVVALALLPALALSAAGEAPAGADSTYPITWTPMSAPLPAGAYGPWGGGINALSCPVVGWCVAIGAYSEEITGGDVINLGLIDVMSDGTASAVTAPVPANALTDPNTNLSDVSCSEVGTCIVVGTYDSVDGVAGLIDTLSDGVWSTQEPPLPAGAPAGATDALGTIVCDQTGACVATGGYDIGPEEGVIATESAGTWSAIEAPVPANLYTTYIPNNVNVTLLQLSCPTLDSCTAIGDYLLGPSPEGSGIGGDYGLFADTESGGTWTASEVPLPANADPGLGLAIATGWVDPDQQASVSCPAAGECEAVSTYRAEVSPGTDEIEGAIATLDDGTWSSFEAPLPDDAAPSYDYGADLASLACSSLGNCVAVGSYMTNQVLDQDGWDQPMTNGLIETLADGTWTPSSTQAADPSIEEQGLQYVSCPADGQCVALGYGQILLGDPDQGYGLYSEPEFFNEESGSWVATVAPMPDVDLTAGDVSVSPLSCPAAGACADALSYFNWGGQGVPLLELDPSLPPTTTTVATSDTGGVTSYGVTVTAGSGVPTGTVTVFTKTQVLCTVTLSGGTGTCTSSAAPSSAVAASYSGDDADSPSIESALLVKSASLGQGRVGLAYSQTLTTTGGVAPVTWSITAGALPAGLTLDPSDGVVSGTPTTSGTFDLTLTATDADGDTAVVPIALDVIAGGAVRVSKSTDLIGNEAVTVSGSNWSPTDTSFSVYQCATPTFSTATCDATNDVTAEAVAGMKTSTFSTTIHLAVGTIDPDGDTCGLADSSSCYVVVAGSSGDFGDSSALSFRVPTASAVKTSLLGNSVDALRTAAFPVGDPVTAQECDTNVAEGTLAGNCDPSTAITGTVLANGQVSFDHSGVTMVVDGAYSDGAGGTCVPGGSCDIVVSDSDNPDITVTIPVSFTTPTVTLAKTTDVAANSVDRVTGVGFPVGDSVTAQECDAAVDPATDLATACDPATAITAVAASTGRVSLGGLRVLVGAAYVEAGTGTCPPGGTCDIVVTDTTSATSFVIPVTLAP